MKIKATKKLNLPELIRYVWENKVFPSVWRSNESPSDEWTIQFFEDGMFRSYNGFHDYDTFTVEVEEELTEETVLSGMTGVYYDRRRKELDLTVMQRTAIKYQLGDDVDDILLAIYVGPTLIWSAEHGIPKDGELEVSE